MRRQEVRTRKNMYFVPCIFFLASLLTDNLKRLAGVGKYCVLPLAKQL